jgi:hypothetical protein
VGSFGTGGPHGLGHAQHTATAPAQDSPQEREQTTRTAIGNPPFITQHDTTSCGEMAVSKTLGFGLSFGG